MSARIAQSVVDYLIKAGIDGARLKAVGYGKFKPYIVDATTAKSYDFLPQGKELTQEFIETLTPEQQEIANQINRHTEYLNHLDQVKLQLTRELRPLSKMKINQNVKNIFDFQFSGFELIDYNPYPHIKRDVAV